jgi:O-antigen/teichoic acid export membrane protein
LRLINQIKNSELGRNVALLMSGNGLSQVVVLLISPLITRLFTTAEIGIYAFFISIVNISSVISGGRYENAIVIAKNEKEAINIFALTFVLSLIVSALLFVGISIMFFSDFSFFENEISQAWAFLIPLLSFLLSLYNLFRFYALRNKKYKHISASMPVESLTNGGLSLLFGWLIGGAWTLIIAGIISKFLAVYILLSSSIKSIRNNIKLVSISEMKNVARIHYKFPLFEGPNALLYTFGQQGIIIFLVKLFNDSIAGIYSYTNRILLTPVQIFSSSFTQVMYQKLSEVKNINSNDYFSLLAKSTNSMFYYLIIPYFIFVFTAKYYVPFIFGDNWAELYKYMYVLAPYSMIILVSAAFTNVFKIDNKQDVALVLKIVFVVSRIAIIIIGASLQWNILQTLLLFSIVSVLSILSSFFVYYFQVKKPIPHSIYSYILVSFVMYFILFQYFNISL